MAPAAISKPGGETVQISRFAAIRTGRANREVDTAPFFSVEFNIVSAPVSAAVLRLSHLHAGAVVFRRHFRHVLRGPRRIDWTLLTSLLPSELTCWHRYSYCFLCSSRSW